MRKMPKMPKYKNLHTAVHKATRQVSNNIAKPEIASVGYNFGNKVPQLKGFNAGPMQRDY